MSPNTVTLSFMGFLMEDTAADAGKCSLSSGRASGRLKTFKLQGINRLLECAIERDDHETITRLQKILDSQSEAASAEIH